MSVIGASVGPAKSSGKPVEQTLDFIARKSIVFAESVKLLSTEIGHIDPANKESLQNAIRALKECRYEYKKISFFLDYFYPQAGKLYNSPAKREVEEPFLEYEDPMGLQAIEAILFSSHPEQKKKELENLVLVIAESSRDLTSLYYSFEGTEAQLMESVHLELIRIMDLYITGYDAPFLKTGIRESYNSLESLNEIINIYLPSAQYEDPQLSECLKNAELYLQSGPGFDQFDRMIFLTEYAIPLEEQLSDFIRKNNLEICSIPNLNYRGANFFRGEVIVKTEKPCDELLALGKKLFFERKLSGNNTRSCATCHQPDKYFTDHLTRNKVMGSSISLKRNTPTLLYAAYQPALFWDGRAGTLTEQIRDVLTSKDEMNGFIPAIEQKLNRSDQYRAEFQKAFPNEDDSVFILKIQIALASYIRMLAPMNSPFDRYMAGNHHVLTLQQKKGFNLFMGKAQCGTCHFAPFFNGATPPFFAKTEYEVLGTTRSDNFEEKIPDSDMGRYQLYPVDVYKRAFKTPTLRNVAVTHPYMHNGSYKSLKKVIEFYNRGGGTGLGLDIPEQTLNGRSLHLSGNEIKDIEAFLHSLTDSATGVITKN